MKVTTILKKTLTFVTPNMHTYRRNSLIAAVSSLTSGAAATVTTIGRGIDCNAKEKHKIKRADRLLSNANLARESLGIYTELAKYTVGTKRRPIILVDWSDLDEYKRHFLLRASLPSHSRSICVYEEVHSIKTKEKPATHALFLKKLAQVLPRDCKPIIVTDAGFKTPWFRSVLAQGWDFVGRTRLPNFYSVDGESWQCITHLYKKATQYAQAFVGHIARRTPLKCRLVLYKQKAKGRKSLNRSGKPKQSKHAKVHIKSARDPWLISSSLPYSRNSATKLVKIYKLRIQIEEGFRDMKSRRFGQGFSYNKTTAQNRLSLLVLLTTLAHWFLMILGMMAKLDNKHRQYQANSLKTGNILSLQFIGQRVAADKGIKLYMRSCLNAIKQLQNMGTEYEY